MGASLKRIVLIALAALALSAGAAEATLRYVSPSGSATYAQCTDSTQRASLSTLNSNAVAGDTIWLAPGTYTTFPQPSNSGSSYASSIVYRGYDREGTIINGVSSSFGSSKHYIKWMTMRFNRSNLVSPGDNVRIEDCSFVNSALRTSEDSFPDDFCVRNSFVLMDTTDGTYIGFRNNGDAYPSYAADQCTLQNVKIIMKIADTYSSAFDVKGLRNGLFDRVDYTCTGVADGGRSAFMRFMNTDHMLIRDTKFTLRDSCAGSYNDEDVTLYMRDSVYNNVWLRDTIIAYSVNPGGQNDITIALSASGSVNTPVFGNRYNWCVFDVTAPQDKGVLYEDGACGDSISHCIFIMRGPSSAVRIQSGGWQRTDGPYAHFVFDHNTFYLVPTANAARYNAISMVPGMTYSGSRRIVFRNNVVYAPNASSTGKFTCMTLDSALTSAGKDSMFFDYNLYWANDRNPYVFYRSIESTDTTNVAPGTMKTLSAWQSTFSPLEANSVIASPRFADSSFTSTPYLLAGSPALFGPDGYVGAYPEAPSEGDITGSANVTLGGATASGTGGVAVGGTSGVTLGGATSGATGGVAVGGTGSVTLGGATASGTGTVGGGPIEGSGNVTLGGATTTATGGVAVGGTASATVGGATLSGTGTNNVAPPGAPQRLDARRRRR